MSPLAPLLILCIYHTYNILCCSSGIRIRREKIYIYHAVDYQQITQLQEQEERLNNVANGQMVSCNHNVYGMKSSRPQMVDVRNTQVVTSNKKDKEKQQCVHMPQCLCNEHNHSPT